MKDKTKFLFDECVALPAYKIIVQLFSLNPDIEIECIHIRDFYGGYHDEQWVPKIANENWIIISGDRGQKRRGKGEILPIVCEQNKITHVLFSGKLSTRKSFIKACAIIDVRQELFALSNEPNGSAFLLGLDNRGHGRLEKKVTFVRHRPERKKPTGHSP